MKKTKKTPTKNVVVKVLNLLLFIFAMSNFFLLLATAGVWMTAIKGCLLDPAVTEPYKISVVGIIFAVIFALLIALEVMMIQIKGKNAVEIFSIILNLAFILFVAIYLTANISAFLYIFCGLGLSFSIIGTMIMIPKEVKK